MKEVLVNGVAEITPEDLEAFGRELAGIIGARLTTPKEEYKPALRMSNIGSPCERKLWYEINTPEEREPLTADTKLKFLYGDIIEATVLFIAKLSGHRVEGQQDRQELHGIVGHRDVVIDGHVVDVKSASSFSYKKFAEGKLREDDAFGYYPQLMSYLEAAKADPIVTEKNKAAFLAIDKTLGHICLDWHSLPDWDWKAVFEYKKDVVNAAEPPERSFDPEPMGKSGNMKLGTFCSYCSVKNKCYPELRTFLYSNGPVFLTTTEVVPNVFEVVKEAENA